MKKILLFVLIAICYGSVWSQNDPYLLVGTYTSGKSEGIYVYQFNTISGDDKLIGGVKAVNPSFLAVSPNEKTVYAVNETNNSSGNGGIISVYSFDKSNGSLTEVGISSSAGNDPCYITTDKTGQWVVAGNYSSGTVALYQVKADGSINEPIQVIQHTGTGPNLERQQSPHVHATVFSNDDKYVLVPDLGIDKVMIYQLDKTNAKLIPTDPSFASSNPGGGPRHLEFHPNNKFVYVIEELTGIVDVFGFSEGKLNRIQQISALPDDFKGKIGSADIHVSSDGRFLYCSNRGDANSIAIYKVEQATGKLKLVGIQSTLGKTPRNFSLDPSGNFLLVANQNSDEIVVFKRNKDSGLLSDTGQRITVPNPVCLKWIKGK